MELLSKQPQGTAGMNPNRRLSGKVQNACLRIILLQAEESKGWPLKTTDSLPLSGRMAFLALKEVKSLEPREADCTLESQQELTRNLKDMGGHTTIPTTGFFSFSHSVTSKSTNIFLLLRFTFLNDLSLSLSFVAETQFSRLGTL